MRFRTCLAVSALLVTLLTITGASADWQWQAPTDPLPAGLSGPAVESRPIDLANPLLKKVSDNLGVLPWAPGEAILVEPAAGAEGLLAYGFWSGPEEYLLLARRGDGWHRLTPDQDRPSGQTRLAYFGHEVLGQAVAWSKPARLLIVGKGGPESVDISRVPLFEAGCSLMVLERAERELHRARQFLGWMEQPAAEVVKAVADCQTQINRARSQLRQQTRGLLDTYSALPEPRYALEDMAWISRHHRGKGFEKIGEPDIWDRLFYGRPEFAPSIEARKAAQEALWTERRGTLPGEARRIFGEDTDFAASITHGLVKYRRDRPLPEPIKTAYRLNLAREEYEPFQVVIASLERPITDATVTVEWEGPGPHPEVSLRPVGYVETKPDPTNFAEYIGWWPDPLMPPGPVQVAQGETQPIWGNVYAPAGTPRGMHEAVVTVQADGMKALTLRLAARVLDFDLGFTHLPSLLSLRHSSIKSFYKLDELTPEIKRRWYAFCLQYRMNPNNIYSSEFIPEEEYLDFCVERGFNAMVMMTPALREGKVGTRNNASNMQVWISDDNQTYRQVPAGWEAGHSDDGAIVISGLDVTARYVKIHSLFDDKAHEFVLRTLERGQIIAYDGDQRYMGPAGYAGKDDGTKPLGSWDATWGAAFDYLRVSLGIDLGEPTHVTKVVMRAAHGATLKRAKRFYEAAKAHGLGDSAYIYGFDEWREVERYGDIKRTYELLKEVAPGIKACSTVVYPVPPIDDVIDAWCPALCYDLNGYKDARKRGQEVWYYAGGAPYDPFPTHELLNVPAVEARAFFWVAWRQQYTGWLHWELNCWLNNLGGEKRWPEVPWNPARSGVRNGEVGRIYPGPDVTPLPSVRLENMRDGIEDYDYFWLLRDALDKLPEGDPDRARYERLIEQSIDILCQSRAHFQRDPEKVLAVHARLGRALERLR